MMSQLPCVQWSSKVDVADWISPQLHPFDRYDAGSVIPTGFRAYVRVLHPAWRSEGDTISKVRWAEIAARTGRIVHPQVQFHMLSRRVIESGDSHVLYDQAPREGSLPTDEVTALSALVAEYTATPDRCWFCLWDGYGWVHGGTSVADVVSHRGGVGRVPHPPRPIPADVLAGPRVRLPHRDFLLYQGAVTAATAFSPYPWHQTPNLWWPDDRAWCIASEIDLGWTYVGGSSALIERILADRRFEAVPARLTDGITYDSDAINH